MACLIPRPAPQTLFDQYRNMFSQTVLGGAQVVPESNEWYVVALNYAMAEEFYAISEQAWRERDPRYACCDNLVALAAADGVFPKSASFAQGYVIITGTAGTTLPGRIEITASNGRNYVGVGTYPAAMPENGALTIRVQDTQPGAAGNAAGTATTGQLATGAAGLDREVTICGGSFCGGADAEECEPFRTRYLARKQYQPRATQAWAMEKLLEWPCATRVVPRGGSCCSCDDGCGGDCNCQTCGTKFDFYVMFDGSFACGIPPENVRADIEAWFFGEPKGFGQGQVEMGICGSIAQITPYLVDIDVDIEGCPTLSQVTEMREQITDLMTTLAPSQPFRGKQIELVVANIIGPEVNVGVRITPVTLDPAAAYISPCGDIEPNCDYLPCLRNLDFNNPSGTANGGCS